MLQTHTVSPELLALIRQLCSLPELEKFHLAGGTAIALQIGHRKSIDIDFFTPFSFDANELKSSLEASYQLRTNELLKNGLLGEINGIKADFLSHQYSLLEEPVVQDGVRMYHLTDLAAMKLNAIVGNGTRLKDYVDVAFLSSRFCLEEMIDCFTRKYPLSNGMMAFKSLAHRVDIRFDVAIDYTAVSLSWEQVNERIEAMLMEPAKLFPPLTN